MANNIRLMMKIDVDVVMDMNVSVDVQMRDNVVVTPCSLGNSQ